MQDERRPADEVLVMDHPITDLQRAVAGVHPVGLPCLAPSEKPGCDERLERRTRLERLGERGRCRRPEIGAAAGHRQNVPFVRIEDHDVTALRLHPRDGVRQLVLRDLLQLAIERKHHGVPWPRGDARRVR